MGLGAVLDTVVGLFFVYLLLSLFCSGVNEALAHRWGKRGQFLREGLVNLVVDRWIYLRLINHPLVASLYRDVPGKPRTPSYVPPRSFADALVDVVLQRARLLNPAIPDPLVTPLSFADFRLAVATCKQHGYSIGGTLLPLLDAAQSDLEQARRLIEGWFKSGTDRITGWYKADTRRRLLFLGIATAVLFNVDTIEIVTALSRSGPLRREIASAAADTIRNRTFGGQAIVDGDEQIAIAAARIEEFAASISRLEDVGLPIGFSCLSPDVKHAPGIWQTITDCARQAMQPPPGGWLVKWIGWLITGLAVCLGAPFWFDLLNRIVDLRGAGKKPESPS